MTSEDALFIPKEILLDEITDFQTLKKRGLEWVQKLSGDIWTDFNEHDPGITILEQLCFALTELGIKSQLDIEKLLFAGKNPDDIQHKFPLYQARDIFPIAPLTAHDYRKLLIDQCYPDLRNVWLLPKQQSALGMNLSGLYEVILLPESPDLSDALVARVRNILNGYRNLCEDFDRISALQPVKIALVADVHMHPNAVGESVLAAILFNLKSVFSPRIPIEAFDNLVEAGMSLDELFSGPPMQHGRISDELLDHNRLEKIQSFFKAQLLKIIASAEGVREVAELRMYLDGAEVRSENLTLPPGTYAELDTHRSRFTLRFGNMVYAPEHQTADYLYKTLENRNLQLPGHGFEQELPIPDEPLPENAITEYYSIQNTFPQSYGVGQYGLPTGATAERKAQAKQLAGYLYPFEQIMANYLAQLLHARRLFTLDHSLEQTYFNQVPHAIPGISELVDLDADAFRNTLDRIARNADQALKRRIAFLDFMLAWFGEEPIPESFIAINRQTSYYDRDAFYRALIQTKIKLLRNFVSLSRGRAQGFNYLLNPFDPENVAGLKKKVSLLFNIENYGFRTLSSLADDQNLQIKTGKKVAGAAELKPSEFQFSSPEKNLVEELLLYGTDRYNFNIEKEGARYVVWYTNPKNKRKLPVIADESNRRCEEILHKLQEYLRKINRDSAGFHLVEHILLRPVGAIQFVSWLSDGEHRILTASQTFADPESSRSHLEKMLAENAQDSTRYDIQRDISGNFSIVLKDAKGKAVAYQEGFTLEKTAQKALKQLQQHIKNLGKKLTDNINTTESVKKGLYFAEDPYSFLVTIVVPNWTARFQSDDFKRLFEQIIKLNAPAYLAFQFLWLDLQEMQRFEKSYKVWLETKCKPDSDPDALDNLSIELLQLIQELSEKYVPA